MKKIINRPADFVDETMEGIVAACGDHIRFLNGDRRVLISGYPVKKGTGYIKRYEDCSGNVRQRL